MKLTLKVVLSSLKVLVWCLGGAMLVTQVPVASMSVVATLVTMWLRNSSGSAPVSVTSMKLVVRFVPDSRTIGCWLNWLESVFRIGEVRNRVSVKVSLKMLIVSVVAVRLLLMNRCIRRGSIGTMTLNVSTLSSIAMKTKVIVVWCCEFLSMRAGRSIVVWSCGCVGVRCC